MRHGRNTELVPVRVRGVARRERRAHWRGLALAAWLLSVLLGRLFRRRRRRGREFRPQVRVRRMASGGEHRVWGEDDAGRPWYVPVEQRDAEGRVRTWTVRLE